MQDRRFKLVKEIMDRAKILKHNKITLYCLIATMTDRRLTLFHTEYMTKNKLKNTVQD